MVGNLRPVNAVSSSWPSKRPPRDERKWATAAQQNASSASSSSAAMNNGAANGAANATRGAVSPGAAVGGRDRGNSSPMQTLSHHHQQQQQQYQFLQQQQQQQQVQQTQQELLLDDRLFSDLHDPNSAVFQARAVVGPGLYYVGIVDTLQTWSWRKRAERGLKLLGIGPRGYDPWTDVRGVSCVAPEQYAERFKRKTREIVEHDFIRQLPSY